LGDLACALATESMRAGHRDNPVEAATPHRDIISCYLSQIGRNA
jgi:hypothetical protein